MIIDNLTIAGLICVSFYLFMPIMMGPEFIKVRTGDEEPRHGRHLPLRPAAKA